MLGPLTVTAGAGLAPASAQDLAPRRGFKVELVEPKSGGVVTGKTTLRAAVTAPREEDVEHVDFFVDDKLVFRDTAAPWQVVHDFGKQGGTHVVRVVATHRDGPTTSAFVVTKSVDLQFVVNVQRVVLDVSVRDAQRRVVQGLGADSFKVTESGRPQKVISVTTDKRPLAVAIVLDSSGSMKERMIEAQDAACDFVEALTEKDKALVINFDDSVFLIHPASPDHASLCRSIRSTEALGGRRSTRRCAPPTGCCTRSTPTAARSSCSPTATTRSRGSTSRKSRTRRGCRTSRSTRSGCRPAPSARPGRCCASSPTTPAGGPSS